MNVYVHVYMYISTFKNIYSQSHNLSRRECFSYLIDYIFPINIALSIILKYFNVIPLYVYANHPFSIYLWSPLVMLFSGIILKVWGMKQCTKLLQRCSLNTIGENVQ